ncbi:MAG: hypothetical protein WC302_00850 [Candidatus Paceibacterota bacterium]|jgi:hypothetical protein
MKKQRKYFLVAVDLPEDMTIPEMADYIREAVETWGGQYSPDDVRSDEKNTTVRPTQTPSTIVRQSR